VKTPCQQDNGKEYRDHFAVGGQFGQDDKKKDGFLRGVGGGGGGGVTDRTTSKAAYYKRETREKKGQVGSGR